MKKNLSLLSIIFMYGLSFSQVGVNTNDPKTTMDVSAKRATDGSIEDNNQLLGLQAPRITRAELTTNTAAYGVDQKAALIYITDISGGAATGKLVNITTIGYYYFDGTVWQPISSGGNSISGDPTNDAWVK